MWDVIRAKNGAYDAWSQFSSNDGIATLFTYRDPNSPEYTLDAFHASADELLQDASSLLLTCDGNAAITTAIIGTIGGLDGSALFGGRRRLGCTYSLLAWGKHTVPTPQKKTNHFLVCG